MTKDGKDEVPLVTVGDTDENVNESKENDKEVEQRMSKISMVAEFEESEPVVQTRRSSRFLNDLDNRHNWLAESVCQLDVPEEQSSFISKTQYVALSNQFQSFLDEMRNDDNLIHVSSQFSVLFEKFRFVFMGCQRLLNKVKELKCQKMCIEKDNRSILANVASGKMALDNLNTQLEEAQKAMNELGKEKGQLELELQQLKDELNLGPIVEEIEVEDIVPIQVNEEKVSDAKRIKSLEETLEIRESELESVKARETKLRERMKKSDQDRVAVQSALSAAKSELKRQTTLKEKADQLASETKESLDKKIETIQALTIQMGGLNADVETGQNTLRKMHMEMKTLQKRLDVSLQEAEKLKRDLVIREDRIKKIAAQRDAFETELNSKKLEIHSLKLELTGANKEKKALTSKVLLLEGQVKTLNNKCDIIALESSRLHKELNEVTKAKTELDHKMVEFNKQREILYGEIQKHEETESSLKNQLFGSEEKSTALLKELKSKNDEIDHLQRLIKQNIRIKERMAKEALDLQKKLSELKNEIKITKNHLEEEEKTSSRLRGQLGQELEKNKTLYDDLRTERKLNVQGKADMYQLQEKMVILNSYAEQLQGLIKNLEDEVFKVKSSRHHLEVDNTQIKESLKQQVKVTEDLTTKLKHKENYENQIVKRLNEKEQEVDIAHRKLTAAIEERDVCNSKLSEKTREASAKSHKIKLQETALVKRDEIIKERQQDIELLKLELSRMQREKGLISEKMTLFDTVKQDVIEVKREHMHEQLKSRAIEEEAQRPVNLHRWRILEGTDPDRAQLLARTQLLQKQLLNKKSELDAKELEIRDKDRTIGELRVMLQRRSECHLQEKYMACKRELRERTDKLKCKTAEVNMYQAVCENYKVQLTRTNAV